MMQRRSSDVRCNLQFFTITINYAGEGMLRHPARPHVPCRPQRSFSH